MTPIDHDEQELTADNGKRTNPNILAHKDSTWQQKHPHDPKRGIQTNAKEMFTQFMNSIELRERDLQEQESALKKQRLLLEQEYPRTGKAEDVLYLNMSGTQTIAVLRSTLTFFENSVLGSRFCGRWDDSLEKTPEGEFFIDQDPEVFLPLVNFLRRHDQKKNKDITIEPPPATAEFCSMLDYYGLMSYVYPQEWQRVFGKNRKGIVIKRECYDTSDVSVTISNNGKLKACQLQVQMDVHTKPVNANSFTVVFEQGSRGVVGWMSRRDDEEYDDDDEDDDDQDDESKDNCDEDPYKNDEDLFCFDIDGAKFKLHGKNRRNHAEDLSRKLPVTIVCTRNVAANSYSIQLLEMDADEKMMIRDTYCTKKHLFPVIYFAGKVTISNVVYAF